MIGRVYRFHDQPAVVEFAQTAPGRLMILGLAVMLLVWHDGADVAVLYLQDSYWLTIVAIAAIYLAPMHTRSILALASLGMLVSYSIGQMEIAPGLAMLQPGTDESHALLRQLVFAGGVMSILFGAFLVVSRFDRLPGPIRKHPVIALHIAALSGLAVIAATPQLSVLLVGTWLLPFLIWRIGYMVLYASHGKIGNSRFRDHLFYLLPIYGGGDLTPGKGLGYLERHEATGGEALAVSQLCGLRLLMFGVVWHWAHELMLAVIYGEPESFLFPALAGWSLDLPRLDYEMVVAAESAMLAWTSIYLELIRVVLDWAAWGAMIIGALRLLGFNVFRNTYKPLLATTLIDFWGRFNYYFKELCVDFFFYPTYLRCSWAGIRLRLFLAVFAAAFLGNFYFHVLLYPTFTLDAAWAEVWAHWFPRLVYSFFLAAGIWVSMLRQQAIRRDAASTPRSRLTVARSIFGVWTFYAVLHIWNVPSDAVELGDRLQIMAALIGL